MSFCVLLKLADAKITFTLCGSWMAERVQKVGGMISTCENSSVLRRTKFKAAFVYNKSYTNLTGPEPGHSG